MITEAEEKVASIPSRPTPPRGLGEPLGAFGSDRATPRSASLIQLEHKIDMENKEQDNAWRSFCLVMNKNAVMYFTQNIIIFFVMCLLSINLLQMNRAKPKQHICHY